MAIGKPSFKLIREAIVGIFFLFRQYFLNMAYLALCIGKLTLDILHVRLNFIHELIQMLLLHVSHLIENFIHPLFDILLIFYYRFSHQFFYYSLPVAFDHFEQLAIFLLLAQLLFNVRLPQLRE